LQVRETHPSIAATEVDFSGVNLPSSMSPLRSAVSILRLAAVMLARKFELIGDAMQPQRRVLLF